MARKKDRVPKEQIGFYFDVEEVELHLRPASGDHMIRPPDEPKKKHKENPWAEAMAFENQKRLAGEWTDAVVGYPDSGLAILEKGGERVSFVGETDGDPFIIEADYIPEPELKDLSPKARGIYFFNKKKKEQGE